jgi:hypothetical protein
MPESCFVPVDRETWPIDSIAPADLTGTLHAAEQAAIKCLLLFTPVLH